MAKSTSSLASSSSATSSASSTTSSAPSPSSSNSSKSYGLKTSGSIDRRKRLAANARERKRMHLLNNAYDQLRRRLADAENKSKYDVLVQAKEYIQALATICEKFDRRKLNQETPAHQSSSVQHQPMQPAPEPVVTEIQPQVSPVDMTFQKAPKQEPAMMPFCASSPNFGAVTLLHDQSYDNYQSYHYNSRLSHLSFT